jgi:hypothetical protein
MKLFVATLAAAFVAAAVAECPNGCSGHGACGVYSDCTCYRNWMGADCSERVCYFGHAFVDTPQGDLNSDALISSTTYTTQFTNTKTWEQYDLESQGKGYPANSAITAAVAGPSNHWTEASWDEAHFYRECSNKGTCNRQTGVCACFPGYEGEGCTRTVCPNDCSGHGTCQRLKDWSVKYEAWDAYSTQHCVCDPGYMGPDCSLRVCPSGDDPVSRVGETEVQKFAFAPGFNGADTQVTADQRKIVNFYGLFALKFTDEFGDSWTTTSLSWPSPPFNDASEAADLCNGTVKLYGTAGPDTQLAYKNPTHVFDDLADVGVASSATSLSAPCSVATAAEVAAALKALPNDVIPDVTVTFDSSQANPNFDSDTHAAASNAATSKQWGYSITFSENSGDVNQLEVLYEVTECVGAAGTACSTTTRPPTATAYSSASNPFPAGIVHSSFPLMSTGNDGDAATDKARNENSICSNRGVCDYSTGICKCFKGYTAHDCSQQNSLAAY